MPDNTTDAVRSALDALDAARELPWQEFKTDAVSSSPNGWNVTCSKHGESAGGAFCFYCGKEREAFDKQQRSTHEYAELDALRNLEKAARAALAATTSPEPTTCPTCHSSDPTMLLSPCWQREFHPDADDDKPDAWHFGAQVQRRHTATPARQPWDDYNALFSAVTSMRYADPEHVDQRMRELFDLHDEQLVVLSRRDEFNAIVAKSHATTTDTTDGRMSEDDGFISYLLEVIPTFTDEQLLADCTRYPETAADNERKLVAALTTTQARVTELERVRDAAMTLSDSMFRHPIVQECQACQTRKLAFDKALAALTHQHKEWAQ